VKIWRDISNFTAKNTVITIGSFDGVHLGHKHVLSQLKKIASDINGESVVLTFFSHPLTVLNPNKKFSKLTTIEEKIELFKKTGIDHLILIPFTTELSKMDYISFTTTILIEKLNLNTILVGYDNKMGKDGGGNYLQLTKLSKKLNFNVIKQDKFSIDNINPNSTLIRELLSNGKLKKASKLLGYPYTLHGTVKYGNQIGSKLGFPTANIQVSEDKFIPANGVYITLVNYNNKKYKGMMNIGIRPTINDTYKMPVIEVHIFDFEKNIYNEEIEVNILMRVRNEYNFNSLNELKNQLVNDKKTALKLLCEEFNFC
jgi:riboflavin kinase/FMN adenylyltransferase